MKKGKTLPSQILLEALEALPDGVSIFDTNGRQIFYNQSTQRRFPEVIEAFEELGAETYKEALRHSVRTHLPQGSEEEIEDYVEKFFQCAQDGTTYEVTTADERIAQITFRPMTNGRKVAISVDVTDLRKTQSELKKARRRAEAASASKSAFLANMSHEIRTPLNGILGMTQVLEGTDLSEEQKDYVSTIVDSGHMLMALLNDILDLSKIEAGKFGISPSETDIMHILRRVLRLWRPKASEKNLNLTLAFDSDMPTHVMIDSVRLQQCVSNLISNAIKFTDSGGVSLRAGVKNVEDGEYLIEISVTDTGCGMDEEDASQLFQPFHQVDDTISRRHGGTGLGLSITKKLAELMGGTATVKSALGRGSIFTVSFRAKHAARGVDGAASIPPLRNAAHEARKVSNLRVLLVDDHPINRQIVQLFLRSYKMNITEAVDGMEALDALERDIFDLVLLDIHMPVMDGPTMVQKIRSSKKPYASLPVIALTADAMSGDKERYLGMGMNGYLAKPLSERDLLSEIIRVVEADRRLGHAKSETKTVA